MNLRNRFQKQKTEKNFKGGASIKKKNNLNIQLKNSEKSSDETLSPKREVEGRLAGQMEEEIINIDRNKLKYCKVESCKQYHLGPHNHQLEQCKFHQFCEVDLVKEIIDRENSISLPFLKKGKEFNLTNSRDYVEMIYRSRELQRLDHKGQKISVTEYSLDHWYAQNYGLDINNMPAYRPQHIDKRVYDQMKKKYKTGTGEKVTVEQTNNNPPSQPPTKRSFESARLSEEEMMEDLGDAKKLSGRKLHRRNSGHPKFDIKNMRADQLIPYIYPKSQKVRALIDQDIIEMNKQNQQNKAGHTMGDKASNGSRQNLSQPQSHREKSAPAQGKMGASILEQEDSVDDLPKKTVKPKLSVNANKPASYFSIKNSPYLSGMMRSDEIESTLIRIKQQEQAKKNLHQEINEQGKATFINVPLEPQEPPKNNKLSTFQKLQMLRNLKKNKQNPIHQMMKSAAVEIPKNHFKNVLSNEAEEVSITKGDQSFHMPFRCTIQDLKDFDKEEPTSFLEHQNTQTQSAISSKKPDLKNEAMLMSSRMSTIQHGRAGRHHIHCMQDFFHPHNKIIEKASHNSARMSKSSLVSDGRKDWKTAAAVTKRHSFRYNNKVLDKLEETIDSKKEQRLHDMIETLSYLKSEPDRNPKPMSIDYANQERALNFNPSMLSPSIHLKKDSLLKCIATLSKLGQRNAHFRAQTDVRSIMSMDDKNKVTCEEILENSYVRVRKRKPLQSLQKELQSYLCTNVSNPLDYQQGDDGLLQIKEMQEKPITSFLERIHIGDKSPLIGTIESEVSKRVSNIPTMGLDNRTHRRQEVSQERQQPHTGMVSSFEKSNVTADSSNKTSIVESKRKQAVMTSSGSRKPKDPPKVQFHQGRRHTQNQIQFINIQDPNKRYKSMKGRDNWQQSQFDSQNQSTMSQRTPIITSNDLDCDLDEPSSHKLNQAYQHINVHLELYAPNESKISKNVFECPEYWLLRGYQIHIGKDQGQFQKSQKEQNERNSDQTQVSGDLIDQALDFYKQGLRIDNLHFGCCYNIGVTYFQQQKNQNALKWFRFAKKIDPGKKAPYLGEATAAFKLGMIEESIEILKSRPAGKSSVDKRKKAVIIDSRDTTPSQSEAHSKISPIKKSQESLTHTTDSKAGDSILQEVKLDIENQFSFLKTISYKQSKKFQKAQREYQKLETIFQARHGLKVSKHVFCSMMLPMQVNRKKVEDQVNSFLNVINSTDRQSYWDQKSFLQLEKLLHFKQQERKWLDIDKAALYLKSLPLFSRMVRAGKCSMENLRDIANNVVVEDHWKCGDIIFDDEEHLYIVMNGRVILRFHEQDPLEYQNIAQYIPGMVIGHKSLDRGLSCLGQAFPIVSSNRAVLFKCNKQFFDKKIWKKTINTQMEVQMKQFHNFPIFQELSDQTLYNIFYEHGYIRLFQPKQKVLSQHPRSPFNQKTRAVYDQEFGHNVKAEVTQTIQTNLASTKINEFSADQSLIKASAYGSFFSMINSKKKQRQQQGITEEMYMNFHRKPAKDQKFNAPDSKVRSLCFVLEGSCEVINPIDNFNIFELRNGNHFGSSDLLKIVDVEYLGDIYAGNEGARILIIPRPEQVIQFFEIKLLQDKFRNHLNTVKYMLENRYALQVGFLEHY